MKICLVNEEYPLETNFGGIATYQKQIASAFNALGHQVIVICRSLECDKEYFEDGIHIIRVFVKDSSSDFERILNYRKRIASIIRDLEDRNMIDIIECAEWGAELIEYLKNQRTPIVVRLHTPLCIWAQYNQCMLSEDVHSLMLTWEKELIERADVVTSCTENLKDNVIKQLGITGKQIKVIPNPANIELFYPSSLEVKSNKILFCGSLEMRKGVHVLAEAISLLNNDLDAEFVFVGKDTTRNDKNISMKKYIYEIIPPRLHSRISFLGQLDNSDLTKLYQSSRMAVFPSLYESFGYVVLEAMACGTPVIGSLNGGMPEIISNNVSGLLYSPPSAEELALLIRKYWNNSEFAKQCAMEARNIVMSKYQPLKIAELIINEYKSAIFNFSY